MNCLSVFRILFIAALLAIPESAASATDSADGVRKVSCALYDIELPAHWNCEYTFDASGMSPMRGTLLYDSTGGETKCHLCYQSWSFFDKNHFEDSQTCHIRSYILPNGGKVDIELLRAILDRNSRHPGSWKKIENGYMKSVDGEDEGFKIGPAGPEKVVAYDRFIDVLLMGDKYVHHLLIIVPENRYRSDEKFRRSVDNIWKNFKLKK